jgi:tetratricopeptide (TPR) repeat protein
MAGLAAMGAGKLDEGAAIIKTLLEKDKISAELQPGVYATVAEAFMDAKKSAQANEWVNAGRKKFPNDQNLLYTAINFAIAENRLAALEAELKQAIDANPTNVELMFIMGNLYDGMFRERVRPNEKSAELNAEDEKLGFESFGKAAGWYERGMKTNPKHFNSVYSLGVLHANHANFCYKKLDALQTKDPTYKIFQQASEEAITKSLNLLLEAEKLEPANTSALDALKSIYGQQNNVAKYEEYKKKSEEARKGK